jgi:excisionase family DNA binding protein
MSGVTRALARELVGLLRTDRQLRDDLRAALELTDDELLTIAAAAEVASVSPATIGRWIRIGTLPAVGRGKATRIRRADLLVHLQRGGRRAVPLTPEALAELEGAAR